MKEGIQFTNICKIPLGGINTQQETSHSVCTCLGQKHHNTLLLGFWTHLAFDQATDTAALNCWLDLPGECPSPTLCSWSHRNEESSEQPRVWCDQAKVTHRTITQVLDRAGTISLFTCVTNDNGAELLMLFWSSSAMKSFSLVIIHPIPSALLVSDNHKCFGSARIPISHVQDTLRSALCPPKLQQPNVSVPACWQCWCGLAAHQGHPWNGKKHSKSGICPLSQVPLPKPDFREHISVTLPWLTPPSQAP